MDRLEQSRSQRILWLLEELKVDYELKIFHRDPQTHLAPPELKEIHPLGKSPVISVLAPGAAKPLVIAESALIVEYLLDHFGNGSSLLPKRYKEGQDGQIGGETEEWLRYRYLMHYAEGSLMPFMVLGLVVGRKRLFTAHTRQHSLTRCDRDQGCPRPVFHQANHGPHRRPSQFQLPGPEPQESF